MTGEGVSIDRSKVKWERIKRAYNLVVEDAKCRHCHWTKRLTLTLVDFGGKVYGVHPIDISHKIAPFWEDFKVFLLVDTGLTPDDVHPSLPLTAHFTHHLLSFNVSVEDTSNTTSYTQLDEWGWTKDVEQLGNLQWVHLREFLMEKVLPFGDCYLFVSEFEGKVYSLVSDLYRVLVFDSAPTTTEISYLPIFSFFVPQWEYKVATGKECFFIEVRDGVHLVCQRWKENPVPRLFSLWEKMKDRYVTVTIPLSFYQKHIKRRMKSMKGGVLEIVSEDGKLKLTFYTSSVTYSYIPSASVELDVKERTPRAGAQIPQPETLNWDVILGIKRKWWEFVPSLTTQLKISIPYNWKTDEGTEIKILPVVIREKTKKYPYLAVYPSGLFYTADE